MAKQQFMGEGVIPWKPGDYSGIKITVKAYCRTYSWDAEY